jgi:hypothetical protein
MLIMLCSYPQILGTIALMEQSNPTNRPAKSRLVSGTWRLVWSQQAENASPLQKWGSSQSKNYQVRGGCQRSCVSATSCSEDVVLQQLLLLLRQFACCVCFLFADETRQSGVLVGLTSTLMYIHGACSCPLGTFPALLSTHATHRLMPRQALSSS